MTTNLGRSTVTFFPSLYMSITTLLWEGRFWVLGETSCYTHVKRHIPVGNATAGEHTRVLLWRGSENTLKYFNPFPPFHDNMGITLVFSCINICWVPRKLFEHEANRQSARTSLLFVCLFVLILYFRVKKK